MMTLSFRHDPDCMF